METQTEDKKQYEIVNTNLHMDELREIANELDVRGAHNKQELVEAINTKIHELAGKKNPKWHEISGFLYEEGDKIEITDGILKDRHAIINKPSAKKNAVKAFLINSKTGDQQNTNVTLDYDKIKLVKEEPEEKVDELKEAL